MGFFYDEYLEAPGWDEKFSKAVSRDVLERFLIVYDFADDSAAWFAKVKEITGGDSLDANLQLVFNNAKLAAQTAVAYCKL